MGPLIGLGFGLGLLLMWRAIVLPRQEKSPVRASRLQMLLAAAGHPAVAPIRIIAICLAAGLAVFVLVAGISKSPVIGLAFAAFASYSPIAVLKRRRGQRTTELREVWPDVVDNLSSGVRAGLALPEALSQLGVRAPEVVRPSFARFAEDYRATGNFGGCLDRLKADLADPVGDRIAESLRVARDVGGSDLGKLLRTLSQFLRDDARTRSEILARQSWTVGAARLGVAAPWVVLGLLALRPDTVAAYDTVRGVAVLVVGGAVSLIAYRIMMRIARLPLELRVLQ